MAPVLSLQTNSKHLQSTSTAFQLVTQREPILPISLDKLDRFCNSEPIPINIASGVFWPVTNWTLPWSQTTFICQIKWTNFISRLKLGCSGDAQWFCKSSMMHCSSRCFMLPSVIWPKTSAEGTRTGNPMRSAFLHSREAWTRNASVLTMMKRATITYRSLFTRTCFFAEVRKWTAHYTSTRVETFPSCFIDDIHSDYKDDFFHQMVPRHYLVYKQFFWSICGKWTLQTESRLNHSKVLWK